MLAWLILIPFGAAFLIPIVARKWRPFADIAGVLAMVCLAAIALALVGENPQSENIGGWAPPVGISLALDSFNLIFLIIINVVGLIAGIFSVGYMRMYTSKLRYWSLLLVMIGGMNGLCLTQDLFSLYVFFEIATISSFALVAFGTYHEELEAAFKYLVLGTVAATFVLLGVALVYGLTGTLNMGGLAHHINQHGMDPLLKFALIVLVVGLTSKAALVPFHAWLPDAHSSAPAPVSALLSGVLIKTVGIYALARVMFTIFPPSQEFLNVLIVLGIFSMIGGGLLALGQWDLKRGLAYSSISQIGYVALAFGIGTPLGLMAGLFHLLNHAVFKSLLFLNAGAVEYATGTKDIRELGGLVKRLPLAANTGFVGAMTIAGIPPFGGFWSKLLIVIAAVKAGRPIVAVTAVLVSILTIAYIIRLHKYVYHTESRQEHVRNIAPSMGIAMVVLALICLGVGVYCVFYLPQLQEKLLAPAAQVLASAWKDMSL